MGLLPQRLSFETLHGDQHFKGKQKCVGFPTPTATRFCIRREEQSKRLQHGGFDIKTAVGLAGNFKYITAT